MSSLNPWPIHPQPQNGESLTSWLARQAQSNGILPRSFLLHCLGEGEWRRRDLDLLQEEPLRSLARLGHVNDGPETLQSMSLNRWKSLLGSDREADRKSWISSIWSTRYCPVCLAEDRSPYLRLLWRLHFIPICEKHRVVLQRSCWKCGRPHPLLSFYSGGEPGKCDSCGSLSSRGPMINPKDCGRIEFFVSKASALLNGNDSTGVFDWPFSLKEFFGVVRFLMRYFSRFDRRGTETLQAHGLRSGPADDWRKNEAIACAMLERSLHILESWPDNMAAFIRENQRNFNRLMERSTSITSQVYWLRSCSRLSHDATFVKNLSGRHVSRTETL